MKSNIYTNICTNYIDILLSWEVPSLWGMNLLYTQ